MLAATLVLALAALGARGETLAALEGLLPPVLLDNLEELVRAATAACELVPLDALAARLEAPDLALDVVEWRRGAGSPRRHRAGARDSLRHLRGAALPIYVPGWWSSPDDVAARALVAALLRHHPAVLVLDTRRVFGLGYVAAAVRVRAVGGALAALAVRLAAAGVPPADLHVLGFSLGAHAAGVAGRAVRARLGGPLGRITALDPARPCFTRSAAALRRADAAFVQVIHSSAGVLGLAAPLGHADVYVARRGECARAPRAAALECDHQAAWKVFAAAARGAGLRARRCAAWQDVRRATCRGERALLPYPARASDRGMFLYDEED